MGCVRVVSLLLFLAGLGSQVAAEPTVDVGEDGDLHINTTAQASRVYVNGIDVESMQHDIRNLHALVMAQRESIQQLLDTTAGLTSLPSGTVVAWHGSKSSIPSGYALCDGSNGTPDLRGRFILGVSASHRRGSAGGKEKVTLTIDQMPRHNHHNDNYDRFLLANGRGTAATVDDSPGTGEPNLYGSRSSKTRGGNSPHNNMPPYRALYYIMKL